MSLVDSFSAATGMAPLLAPNSVRVLLVDDSVAFRDVVLCVLRSIPIVEVVGVAADGRAAVAQSTSLHPDVILMDIAMPGMSGLEATRAISRRQPGSRVIMLLSNCTEDYQSASLASGAMVSIAKERLDTELLPAIELAIGRANLGQAC